MSNIINKVKDALTGHDHTTDTSHESAGTTHRAGHTGVGTTTDTSATGRTAGPHRSDVANKVDPRVDSDRDGSRQIGTTGTTGKTAGVGGYGSHHGTTTYGPHSTNVGNKLDPTVDSDLSGTHRATGGGAYTSGGLGTTGFGSGATGLGSGSTGLGSGTYHTTTTGPHSSDLLSKADPRVDSDRDGSRNMGAATYGPGATTHGTTHSTGYSGSTNVAPHDSNIANKLDPRVDSDRDGSRNMGMRETTAGTGTHYGTTGTTGLGSTGLGSTGAHYGTGYSSTNAGPHDSNVANKLDPRVDSDRDHRATHAGGVTSIGVPGSHHTSAGPHSSDIANKVDPRVDSDRDHRAAGTTGTYGRSGGILGTGTGTGDYTTSTTHQTSTTYGPHSTNTANKLDPRVDSDHARRTAAGSTIAGTTYGTTHGTSHGTGHGTSYGTTTAGTTHGAGHTGPAPHTAGPHKSDMMNKLDPRVDSDLDGSKTMGGNKTFASPGSHHA